MVKISNPEKNAMDKLCQDKHGDVFQRSNVQTTKLVDKYKKDFLNQNKERYTFYIQHAEFGA